MQTDIEFENLSASGMRFAVIVSRWNSALTEELAFGAAEALKAAGAFDDDVELFRVPGAFELPLASQKAAASGRFDAVIALGVVIRGETPHFDFVAGQAASGIMRASLQTEIPIMFGVVTADNLDQAKDRCGGNVGNKGSEAARSAIETVIACRQIERVKIKERLVPNVA